LGGFEIHLNVSWIAFVLPVTYKMDHVGSGASAVACAVSP